jgi:hypothetical protein
MERYFTTVALLGVNDGNLPVHRYLLTPNTYFIHTFTPTYSQTTIDAYSFSIEE